MFTLNYYNSIYFLLIILRILLTVVPQTGYIHPDEFFQTFEIISDKILDFDVIKPWEFNTTNPIRSIFSPYVVLGLGFKVFQLLNFIFEYFFAYSLISPYFVLVIPRLIMCFISFINDYCLYKICKSNNEKFKSRLIILASSYVMITYGTRTFTNTIELALFSILLYYVADSMIFSNIVVKQSDYINMRHNNAKTAVEKAKFHKLRLYLPGYSFRNCFFIATICTVGFFNRPTFVAFAVGPVFFWLFRGIGSKSVLSLNFNIRTFLFCLCTIPSIIFIITFDSFFYGYLSWGEIGMLDVSINNFVTTPWNFIKYNLNSTNLSQHGLHPRYLHVVLNIPLLFNILGFLGLYNFLMALGRICDAKLSHLPSIKSIKALMVATCLMALIVLSIVPHQEPRFLIPLLIPFVYLNGSSILSEQESAVIEKNEKEKRSKSSLKGDKSHKLIKIWIFSNLLCILFFGFIHQGGVIQIPGRFHGKLEKDMIQYHLVTSYSYDLPYSLFLQKSSRTFSVTDFREIINRKIIVHQLHSASYSSLSKTLININNHCFQSKEKRFQKCEIFAFWPTSLERFFLQKLENLTSSKIVKIDLIYPHFSTESLDYLNMYRLNWWPSKECDKKIIVTTYDYVANFLQFFTLSAYEVVFNKTAKLL